LFRSALAAALRHLYRGKLYAAIAVFGLAVGLCAALLAYHIDLPLWLFPATTLATVLIALATVSAFAIRVARPKPVTALRYE
jgi:hypothetical protein